MKYLAIGSHADDIELGCSGTLARAAKQGHDIMMLVMSDKPVINYDGTILRSKETTLAEAFSAATALNAKIQLLNFDQKDVPFDSTTVEAINRVLDEYKPDYIFTQWVFDTHQAHRNTALSTVAAGRNFDNIFFYEPFPPSGRSYMGFRPQVYVDISDSIEDKKRAVEAHASQVAKYGAEWVESVVGRAKLRGWDCGVRYAEAFELLRMKLEL